MENDKLDQAIRQDFAFMFKKISTAPGSLMHWFQIPEFIEGLRAYKANNVTIDNESVYELMVDIYKEKEESGEKFNHHALRQSIHQIQKHLKP